ncbi:putative membrane protein YeiB [Nonomuraea muscovyensis]|uniref:Putative membrane protein YeiB n=1 Tax=Nonomuraea muscovyensis TaxID=1124761 RepID=A0A7X0C2H4_9ACTN|nr:DUF418 domain-containing protein [Nonomuraea muscovyensis]MBB6345881.1 putative membrane protein YeiB [Nonomuraea muscovyensis]
MTVSGVRGTASPAKRVLAPDLARGGMLLLIAIANTPWYLWGRKLRVSTIHPPGGSVFDRSVQVASMIVVDFRVYPMFAFLFGYGVVQFLTRQEAAGQARPGVLAQLRRRNLWLLAFGFVHAALLWQGDILGAYGLAGLLLARLFLHRDDRTLLTWSAIGSALLTLVTLISVVGAYLAAVAPVPPEMAGYLSLGIAGSEQSDPLAAALARLTFWPVVSLGQGLIALALPVAIVLGFWAARRQILEGPGEHLPLLRRVAIIGIAIGWLGGLPHAAAVMGWLTIPPESMFVFEVTQMATGLPAGLGYAAFFGLLGHRLSGRRPGPIISAVTAVGKRSLSAYLAQSVLCAPVLAAWGLGLGAHLHSASTAGYAIGVWLFTVAGARLLERGHLRGPAEIALRRLSRRPHPRTEDR